MFIRFWIANWVFAIIEDKASIITSPFPSFRPIPKPAEKNAAMGD